MDKVEIIVESGNGGAGVVSFRREKYVPFGGPDGGDGGSGGNVFVRSDENVNNLIFFRHKRKFKAGNGKSGGGKKKFGKDGEDEVITVPMGTIMRRIENGDEIFLADMSQHNKKVLVARGGRGGLGNVHFATATNQAPRESTSGGFGETVSLMLDLKLIADVGIIGYPNVGKSTLLTAVSAAEPKIADYPFTTLEAVLGEVKVGKKYFVLAEIPGLIEGAHLGRGLGHDFLRHAERTRILVQLLDGNSSNLMEDMNNLNTELALYKHELIEKLQIVAVSKIDLPEVRARIPEIKGLFKSTGVEIHFISSATGEGVPELMAVIAEKLGEIGEYRTEEAPPVVFRPKPRER